MLKTILLKYKSRYYVFILGLLNIFAFSVFTGCSNNKSKNIDSTADSLAGVKKYHDSMTMKNHIQDSIDEIKRIRDSITLADSIKKTKHVKNNFKPIHSPTEYGVGPTF